MSQGIMQKFKQYHAYMRTVGVVRDMPDERLRDIGVLRGDIRSRARQAAGLR